MKTLVSFFCGALVALIQLSVAPFFPVLHVSADLSLSFAIAVSIAFGAYPAALAAVGAGIVLDVFLGGVVMHTAFYLFAVLASGFAYRRYPMVHPLFGAVIASLCILLRGMALLAGFYFASTQISVTLSFIARILTESLLGALWTVIMFALMLPLIRMHEERMYTPYR